MYKRQATTVIRIAEELLYRHAQAGLKAVRLEETITNMFAFAEAFAEAAGSYYSAAEDDPTTDTTDGLEPVSGESESSEKTDEQAE